MTFTFSPAVRDRASLLIGLCGPSGSGKSFSALALATGLAGPEGRVVAIDSEAGRLKHYADQFKFDHGDMKPPFGPDRYIEAVKAADDAGYDVIVIDSLSHEWESEGGLMDMHDTLLEIQVEQARKSHNASWAFDENKTRERLSIGAWKLPKMQHKRFVSRLLQCRAHLVICMRADEKMRIEKVKDDRGRERTVILQAKDMPPAERWSPICERRFPYELTMSLILTPQAPGVPVPVKLQEQHRGIVRDDEQLTVDTGRLLAEWARGGVAPKTPVVDTAGLLVQGDAKAKDGMVELGQWWTSLTSDERKEIGPKQLDAWKIIASTPETESL